VLPAGLLAKALQLCAAGLGTSAAPVRTPVLPPFVITVHAGAMLTHQPDNEADAEATVRDLLTREANFDAGPLAISGHDFQSYDVTPTSVFDSCALARLDTGPLSAPVSTSPTIASVAALLRSAFGARITDTVRPMNASYGALHSWHKAGQAVDFVPSAGVMSINRAQVRALMAANNISLLELLGPGDRGHANHWHLAFAKAGQPIDQQRPIEGDEDWIITAAAVAGSPTQALVGTEVTSAPVLAFRPITKAPPQWDVFGAAEWRAGQGSGS
jgi:hypothetical protein